MCAVFLYLNRRSTFTVMVTFVRIQARLFFVNLERHCMTERNNGLSFFRPVRFEDFSPDSDFDTGAFLSKRDETYRVIGEATITMTPYKNQAPKRIIFLQPSCLPSIRYAVIVPEGVHLGDSITFIQRKTKQEKQKIRMNLTKTKRKEGEVRARIKLYRDPKVGSYIRWDKSLVYQKTGAIWRLVEVDGQPCK